jgi:hypothetical protein
MSEQGQVSTEHSPFARRIGSRLELATASHPQGWIRAWTLRIVPVTLIFPALMNLVVGNLAGIVGVAVAFGCCYGAVRLMEAGGEAELDFQGRTIAKAPRVPRKLLSSIVLGLGVVVAAAATAGIELGFALGGIACLGSVLAYGLDPREDKGINPKIAARAGVKLETLVKAITEPEGKLTDIDRAARRISNRELRDHLHRITTEGRNILLEIERDPGDIRRARRFLVTYLDGTRDVVNKYVGQQQDLAESPLRDNFRHVLEVLKTQLQREGVA